MKKLIVVLLLTVTTTPLYAHQRPGCISKDHVYCQIKEHSPKLSDSYVRILSKQIKKSAKKYKIKARLLTAIIGAESSFRLKAVRKTCGYRKNKRGVYSRSCIGKDFGLTQISLKTAKGYNLNIDKLMNNMEYSIDSGAKVLKWFKDVYGRKELRWYLRYNCGTHKNLYRKSCGKYQRAIEGWW